MQTGNKTIIIALLLLGTICSAFQCNKRIGCGENIYGFSLGIKAYPDKEVIRIGDTIWFEIDEPTTLRNAGTGSMIDYSGAANLGTAIGIAKIISKDKFDTEANKYFNFNLQKGIELARVDTKNIFFLQLVENMCLKWV